MSKLSDTQRVLLSNASQRDDGSVLPLTGTLASGGGRVDKSIAGLITRGLIDERETTAADAVHRTDGDLRYGLYLTAAGAAAIGVSDDAGEGGESKGGEGAALLEPPPLPAAPKAPTKSATVLSLLQRSEGATLPELIAATGWLPHTTRAALTGLRKQGHAIERTKRDDATCYRVGAAG